MAVFSGLRRRFNRSADDENPYREGHGSTKKSRRPPNTAFRQQRLKSWQPILTPRTVLPMLLLLAVICIPLGIAFILTTYKVQKFEVNYSNCASEAKSAYADVPSKYVHDHFKTSGASDVQWKYSDGTCTLSFEVPNDIKGPLYQYYKMTKFYQNHRKYVESYDWKQLRGEAVPLKSLDDDCKPLKSRNDKIVYPCGLVANSMFNDTFGDLKNGSGTVYNFSSSGIAWHSDLSLYKRTKYNLTDIVPPENWAKKYPDGYTDADLDALAKDERFMNWMKTASLPSFMKMYGINKEDTLPKGNYTMAIGMNYPVSIYGGTKSVVISTSSVIGGRNMGLGIVYCICGGLAVLFMLGFLVKQIFGKRKSTHTFLDELTNPQGNSGANSTGLQGQRDVL